MNGVFRRSAKRQRSRLVPATRRMNHTIGMTSWMIGGSRVDGDHRRSTSSARHVSAQAASTNANLRFSSRGLEHPRMNRWRYSSPSLAAFDPTGCRSTPRDRALASPSSTPARVLNGLISAGKGDEMPRDCSGESQRQLRSLAARGQEDEHAALAADTLSAERTLA